MAHQLSNGAISRILGDTDVENPVLQILGFKKIAGPETRFRLHISDGVNSSIFAMLSPQLNHLVEQNVVDNYSVIKVDKMILSTMKDKRVMIISHFDVIAKGAEVGGKIGNPILLTEEHGSSPASSLRRPLSVKNKPSSSRASLYGNKPSSANTASSTSSMDMSKVNTMPIQDVNPYSPKLPIRARVTKKSEIKNWSNSKGVGKLFSMDLLDETGEIRLTAFNQSVDQFYDMIEEDKVYYINKFSVKAANMAYSGTGHDYELTCGSGTQITSSTSDDSSEMPKLQFNFIKIANIEHVEKEKIIDVLGICKQVCEASSIIPKSTQRETIKREIILVDDTNKEITLTLWGKRAENFQDNNVHSIIAVKRAKVTDFAGKSLTLNQSSLFQLNPDIEEAHTLRDWYDTEGMQTESISVSDPTGPGPIGVAPWKVLSEANTVQPGDLNQVGFYFKAKVTLMAIRKDNLLYKACPSNDCSKKVVDMNDGLYRCHKCQTSTTNFKWQLMVSANFADFTDHVWATSFNDKAEMILGHKAQVLASLSETEPKQLEPIVEDAMYTEYIAKFRSRIENYNNETRMKFTVVELKKLNFAEYSKKLLAELNETTSS